MKNFKEMVYGNLFEAKMATRDYDGDGQIETSTEEYLGSRDKAIKKATGKLEEEEKKPSKQDVTEKDILKILKDQGGAADLKKVKEELRKIGKKVPADKALKAMVGKIKTVTLHRGGDYVEITGLNKKDVLSKMTKK